MSSTALILYWARAKSFARSYWKYAAAFTLGSFVSSIFSFFFAKSISGKSAGEIIWWYMIAQQKKKYRNIIKYDKFSIEPSPIRPSTANIAWDAFFRKYVKAKSKFDYKSTAKEFRKDYLNHRKMNLSQRNKRRRGALPPFIADPEAVIIKENSVNHQGPIKGYNLSYPGCDINNGVIYYIHGGGFYMGYPEESYGMLRIMMQYLGCAAFAIEYHFCPEISIPQQVDECIEGYKYILNKLDVDSKKVFICGASAGGALSILTLQKLNKLSLPQPCGAIIISAGPIDSTFKTALKTEEDGIKDAMFNIVPAFMDICIDGEDRKEYENGEEDKVLSLPKYCALNGDWKGLCPLYVSASQQEVMINDNKLIVDKCKEFGVDVEYDWDPFLLHVTVVFADYIPEARDKLMLVIQWMKKQRHKNE